MSERASIRLDVPADAEPWVWENAARVAHIHHAKGPKGANSRWYQIRMHTGWYDVHAEWSPGRHLLTVCWHGDCGAGT